MFTGIVTHSALLAGIEHKAEDRRLTFETDPAFLDGCRAGDSIAVSGVCLTAMDVSEKRFCADVSVETLRCTTIGDWQTGQRVNLERPMRADGRFDGHLVSGHVDGTAVLVANTPQARSLVLTFEVGHELSRYIAPKGSVCLDGVSLTVNDVSGDQFQVNIIPHTRDVTGLGGLQPDERVNIEVDLVARYLQRLLDHGEGKTR
ncbi:MAG: riboflavin synthase [Xanthomonadales bacterium]|nr:riboflavin synthase [Xanthomonadales bacterium]NNL95855.1 riboflavin synthase [Xanthomonadales bacterium]